MRSAGRKTGQAERRRPRHHTVRGPGGAIEPASPARVLHLASQFPPQTLGGLGTHVEALSRRQCPHLRVLVLGPERGVAPTGVAYTGAPGRPWELESAVEWARRGAALLARDPPAPTVLHAHNYEVALPALALHRLTGFPLVVTHHLPAPPSQARLERRLLEAAGRIVAVSAAAAAGLAGLPVTVILNGVDTGFYRPDPAERRETRTLLLAGRLTPQKGVDLAIRALAGLVWDFPDARLRVAGSGEWDLAYLRLARRLGVADRIDWLGWLAGEALRGEYRRCGALLMPSRYEPFGLSALEGMACGAPVVASLIGGLPEFIEAGETGLLVPPESPEALAGAISHLWRDPAGAERLGKAAARAASGRDWQTVAEALREVYASLLPEQSVGFPAGETAWLRLRSEIEALAVETE